MTLSTKNIGSMAENQARRYLELQGLSFVEKNFRSESGEIDLIMQDQETLVFVEVRYRQQRDYGQGIETLTESKKQKIIKTAMIYLQQNNLFDKVPCRFDVVGVDSDEQFAWIPNAFEVKY